MAIIHHKQKIQWEREVGVCDGDCGGCGGCGSGGIGKVLKNRYLCRSIRWFNDSTYQHIS